MIGTAFRTVSLLAIAVMVFVAWVHVAILDPSNVGWLLGGQDAGQSALGLAAYLRNGNWPGTRETLLSAPEGVTLLFSDSNPLIGLLLWPVAPWLPGDFQVIGPWLFGCLCLHAMFAWLLVRPYAPGPLAAWLATALMTLMPTLLNRLPHANLCAHWLILWALWIFIEPSRARKPLWWAAVLAVAALVHSYLLIMVALIWASALRVTIGELPGAWERTRAIAAALLIAALVVGLAALDGVFDGKLVATGTYGQFQMPIDALINPANRDFTALLPSSVNDGHGFEGFQYLGAGLLGLALVALIIGSRVPPRPDEHILFERLRWLVPALVLLTLVAIGHQIVARGTALLILQPPGWLVDLFDPVRASGRLFWPVGYVLVLSVIVTSFRWRRGAVPLLALALAVQIVDLRPMLEALRGTTAEAEQSALYRRTTNPAWNGLIAGANGVDFYPPENFRNLTLMQEIGWRAIGHCRPLNFFYAARRTVRTQARLDAQMMDFNMGKLDPTRLSIILDPVEAPVAIRSRIRWIDGVAVVPPTTPAPRVAQCRPRAEDAIFSRLRSVASLPAIARAE